MRGTLLGPPTIAGYTAFLRRAGINTIVLPDGDFAITLSLSISEDIVSRWLNYINCDIYTLAVYNLATDRLIHFKQDDPTLQPPSNATFFADLRAKYNINSFIAGVVSEAHDETTGQTIAVSDALKNLSLFDLSTLQTPYGRAYMEFAQMLGTLWGLT